MKVSKQPKSMSASADAIFTSQNDAWDKDMSRSQGLMHFLDAWLGDRADTAVTAFIEKEIGGSEAMPLSAALQPNGHVSMILASPPVKPSATEVILQRALTRLRNSPELSCPLGNLAKALQVNKRDLAKAINARGSRILGQFYLALENDLVLAFSVPISARPKIHQNEKCAIATPCARLVKNGDIVLMDGGSTTLECYHAIAARVAEGNLSGITVVTNSFWIANAAGNTSVRPLVYLVGGEVVPEKGCTHEYANDSGQAGLRRSLDEFKAKVYFAKSNATDRRVVAIVGSTLVGTRGCGVRSENESISKPGILGLADFGFIVVDHSKYVFDEPEYVFAPFRAWDSKVAIVTDRPPPPDFERVAGVTFDTSHDLEPIWERRNDGANVVRFSRR